MAGTRKKRTNTEILCFLVLFCAAVMSVDCLSCLSQQNEFVDWYIAYKLPGSEKTVQTDSFFYMDAISPSWMLSPKTLQENGQAIYNTLHQIYSISVQNMSSQAEDILYLMYNDEFPESAEQLRFDRGEKGHTKGVIAFDSRSGFWLVHSTPKFPPTRSAGYTWPESANTYAQTFLCVSMETDKNLNEIGHQLLYNYPGIYDHILPKSFGKYENLADAIAGKHVMAGPWHRETKLTSQKGVSFLSFAKYANFDNDLYSDLVAPRFDSTLLVETWQNGRNKLCSNCTGRYKVFNIDTLEFKQHGINFKETQDHAKWAVTNSTSSRWTCIGDINRQLSQIKRPGGTVCFQNKSVWLNFHSLISSYHKCGPYKECVPP